MSSKYSFDQDVKNALMMAQGLSDYVRGERLYGYVAAGRFSGMRTLTGGALIMRLRRLHLLRSELKDYQVKNLDKAIDLYEGVRDEWTFHYQTKLIKEAHSRIDAMKSFFYECGDNMRNCMGIYKPELLRRTIVQEICQELEALDISDSDLEVKIKGTDTRLERYVEPADFQWSEEIQSAYDKEIFWWLYHCPPNLR